MEIIVFNTKIETKDIVDIYEIEKYKKRFLNREAGFVIVMSNGHKHVFGENIPYESYPSEIREKHNKWRELQKQIEEQWGKDKSNIPVFKIW